MLLSFFVGEGHVVCESQGVEKEIGKERGRGEEREDDVDVCLIIHWESDAPYFFFLFPFPLPFRPSFGFRRP
jgi:hypothetical protein